MNNDVNTPSDWSATANEAFTSGFNPENLPHARKLHTTGTTCDAYDARINGVRVFIKKLKPEYAGNPIHLNAFRKEYEVGANLRHTSLPVYRDLRGDAIIMEYIDGRTLARMIQDNDTWLHDDRNIEKIMGQLLDVVDYLHQHGVVHCDLKPDNIMVTFGTGSVVLVDLDKSYTDARDLTPGTATHYGLPDSSSGSPEADIRGLGRIAGLLTKFAKSKALKKRLEDLSNESCKSGGSVTLLKDNFNRADGNNHKASTSWAYILGGLVVILLAASIVWLTADSNNDNVPDEPISDETVQLETDEPVSEVIPQEPAVTSVTETKDDKVTPVTPPPTGGNKLNSKLIKQIQDDFVGYNRALDALDARIQAGEVKPNEVSGIIMEFFNRNNEFHDKILNVYYQQYPGMGINEMVLKVYDLDFIQQTFKRRNSLFDKLIEIQNEAETQSVEDSD